MGCFCRELVPLPPQVEVEVEAEVAATSAVQPNELVGAVWQWLTARWLPSRRWQPKQEWLEIEVPEPPLEPEAMAVLSGLGTVRTMCIELLGLDPGETEDVRRLTRIVGTLNRRVDQLQELEQADRRPWEQVALLNEQVDLVRDAIQQGVFEPQETQEPFAPWRLLVGQVKALAPLYAMGEQLQVDWTEEDAPQVLAQQVRRMRQVVLPPLEDEATVLRLISRQSAIARIIASLGADPREVPFERVVAAVQRKVRAVEEQVPQAVMVQDGVLAGMPMLPPNPAALVNDALMDRVRQTDPRTLQQIQWTVPKYRDIPLLAVGLPVAGLVGALSRVGANPVRQSPCDRDCDAARAMRALDGGGSGAADDGGVGLGGVAAVGEMEVGGGVELDWQGGIRGGRGSGTGGGRGG